MATSSHTLVTWHGHSNFQITSDGLSVLIDPFFSNNPACSTKIADIKKPDLILITHDHGDHTGDAIDICKATGATCGCIVGTAQKLLDAGMPQEAIPAGIGFNIGGTLSIKGIKVTMTQAFHSSDSAVCVGYVITMPNGLTIYHSGDTGIFASMELIGTLYPIDLALLPIGGFFTMDAYQAAHAVKLIKPKAVIPMHYATFPVLAQDSSEFAANLTRIAPECRLIDVKPGQSVTL